jgi:hypothetical protein
VRAQKRNAQFRPLIICGVAISSFILMGLLLIPMLGLEVDEVMFAKALLVPRGGVAWFSFYHHYYPSMLMSYMGALKSWLYAPLAILARPPVWPGIWAIRLPMLLLAAFTIGLTGRLLWMIAGERAAVCVICLLSTDSSILLTAAFDWGPVVLQNFLLVCVLLLLLAWRRFSREWLLFYAAIVLGLALWNKALFLWNFSGMLVALSVVAFKPVMRLVSFKRAVLIIAGLALGAYPLLRYNVKDRGPTLRRNANLGTNEIGPKLRNMAATINGQLAPVQLVDMRQKAPDTVARPFAAESLWAAGVFAAIRTPYLLYVETAAILLGLFAGTPGQRRWIGFFALSFLIGWAESVATVGAGSSVHHTALFLVEWYCALALSIAVLAAMGRLARVLAIVVTVLICLSGLASQNVIYANMLSFDAQPQWSNADEPLLAWLTESGVKRAVLIDWGISDLVTTLSRNQIAVTDVSGALSDGNFDANLYRTCLAPACVVIGHSTDHTIFDHASKLFTNSLVKLQNSGNPVLSVEERTFADTHRVPIYRVLELRTAS